MTSKSLFIKRMKQELEQRVWLPVVFFILSFLTMEMRLISHFDNIRDWGTEPAEKYVMQTFLSINDSGFVFFTILVAFVSALSGFSYLHSARKLDVYHSLPVRRKKLFGQQYVYGILYYAVPFLVHILLCIIICVGNGVGSSQIYGQFLGYIFVNLLVYLAVYSVTVFAVCLTGNIVVSVLGSVVLLVYSGILSVLKYELMRRFFVTYYSPNGEDVLKGIWAFSPLHLLFQMCDSMSDNTGYIDYTGFMGYYVKLFLMILVYTVGALWLYQKRQTESAGKSMAFGVTEPLIKTMVVFPASFGCGYIFCGIASNSNSFGWYLFGCIFGFIVICPLMEIIFRKDVKAVFARPIQLAVNGVLVLAVVFLFRLDVFGYDTYIPDADKVESYGIYINEVNGRMNYSTYEMMNSIKVVDNESTRRLLEHGAECTRPLRTCRTDILNGDSEYTGISVRYYLKNGKKVCRSYAVDVGNPQVMQWLADTYDDDNYKEGLYSILSENFDKVYNGVEISSAYMTKSIQFSKEEMNRFLEVYREELRKFSFMEMTQSNAIAQLAFTVPYDGGVGAPDIYAENVQVYDEKVSFEYYYADSGYRIYPEFTESLSLLKSYGVDLEKKITLEDIISIEVEDATLEADDHNGLYDKLVTLNYAPEDMTAEEVQEILDSVIPNRFIEGVCSNRQVEDNIHLYIEFYNDDGRERTLYCSFKKDGIPEFIRVDMKEAAREMLGEETK